MKKLVMCEGPNEKAVVDILMVVLDGNKKGNESSAW